MNRTVRALLAANRDHATTFDGRFDDLQDGQRPDAVSVCCADSRVLGDHLWGNDRPGRVFTVANIGNRVDQRTGSGRAVSGDVLYPVRYTDTRTVVVVGHTGCGAVTAAHDALSGSETDHPPGVAACVDLLAPRLAEGVDALPAELDREAAVNRLVEYNVDRQVEFLRASEAVPDAVDVVGVVYDFQDVYDDRRGTVHVVNVDGERSAETLRASHPEVAARIRRIWAY